MRSQNMVHADGCLINNLTWKLFLIKYKQGLSTNKVIGFNDIIQLYNTYVTISKYNTTQLYNLLQRVVAIKLINTGGGV